MSRKSIPVSILARAAKTRRSSLYVWMLENHDTFRGVVKEAVRPNWDALAETFAAKDLRDAEGKPPSAETTRQTWWKVRKMVEARAKSAGQPQQPRSTPKRSDLASRPTPDLETPDDPPPRPAFRPAKIR